MSAGPITPGMHPNYNVQLPVNLSNLTGISINSLENQFPQNWFAFSGVLIGYFDNVLPGTQAIWTTRWTEFIAREEPETLRGPAIITKIYLPMSPPVVLPPHCYHDCHPPPPPPVAEVPEISSGLMILLVLAIAFVVIGTVRKRT